MLSPYDALTGGRVTALQDLFAQVISEDLEWLGHGNRRDKRCLPWMPFQAADFIALMVECVAVTNGPVFLDVGSGIGTKMELARAVFGMHPTGIEIDPAMVKRSNQAGRGYVEVCDALTAPGHLIYGADVIWMYRPFRDGFEQAKLEHRVFELAKPGAVIVGGQWENKPSGWSIVVDDWDTGHRGAWQKPMNWRAEYEEYSAPFTVEVETVRNG